MARLQQFYREKVVPDLIKKFEAGYIAGAKAVNPAIKVDSKYLGAAGDNSAWGNVAGAKEIAKGWYDAGADVIYTAAGGSGAGTILNNVAGSLKPNGRLIYAVCTLTRAETVPISRILPWSMIARRSHRTSASSM